MDGITVLLCIVALALLVALGFALWMLVRLAGNPQGAQVQIELQRLVERISTMERGQSSVEQNIHALSRMTTGVTDTTRGLQGDLAQARDRLTELRAQAQERALLEQGIASSVRRLEMIIAGTQSKGAAGENIVEPLFSQLPVEWQVRNFTVGNKTVEFALRLPPNNRVVPIDSKWAATALVERFAGCDDPDERQRLKRQIESCVRDKAREVNKYLDPNLTHDFGIAVVPDAVYELCTGVQGDCFQQNVMLIAYSMFLPYLLLTVQMSLRMSQTVDLEKLDSSLHAAEQSVVVLQGELENRLARSLIMLGNSREAMSSELRRLSNLFGDLQTDRGLSPSPPVTALAPVDDLPRASASE